MEFNINDAAQALGGLLTKQGFRIATAESCTGGLLAATLTRIPGSSSYFDRGFVTYSELAKHEMLGVQLATLQEFGAVSAEVAEELALGVLKHSHAQLALAITGFAGPGGGTKLAPVGTVYFGMAQLATKPRVIRRHFGGSRAEVCQEAVSYILQEAVGFLSARLI